MLNAYDIAYGMGLGASAPYWMLKPSARRKVFRAIAQRMGHVGPRDSNGPAILIHAVSLGEINATRLLVKLLQQARPDLHIVVSTTTETGYARGQQLYPASTGVTLVRYPLDFTGAIDRLLGAVRPSLVVLMELELWPNFLKQCEKRKIPVVLINGRMTPPAFRRYRLGKLVTARMLRRLAIVCVQDQSYAEMFKKLGAPANRVFITGTMKFDTAEIQDRVDGDERLAKEVGLVPGAGPIWVCGSTGPGEEPIVLAAFGSLLKRFPDLRLVIVPRKPERFDEVARLIERSGFGLLRRSLSDAPASASVERPVILGDTMGELRKFYSLADVVLVGRTLVDLGPRQHGSDMIEPAALAKPIIIGPWTHNFAEAMRKLRAADAVREVRDESTLTETIGRWLEDPQSAIRIGRRAQGIVRENQGATARHAEILLGQLPAASDVQ
jgi:3-deoxy-D-manno-octulosonic-acid transferase